MSKDKISNLLIDWLQSYTGMNKIEYNVLFSDLKFDIFDEAVFIDFVFKKFNVDINQKGSWFQSLDQVTLAIFKHELQ